MLIFAHVKDVSNWSSVLTCLLNVKLLKKKTHLNKDVCFGHIYIDQPLRNSLDKKQECILCERPLRVSERYKHGPLRLIYNYFGAGNLD